MSNFIVINLFMMLFIFCLACVVSGILKASKVNDEYFGNEPDEHGQTF